jgi:hypothetical protein
MGKNFEIEIVTELKCSKLYCIWFSIANGQDDTIFRIVLGIEEERKWRVARIMKEKKLCILFCSQNTT